MLEKLSVALKKTTDKIANALFLDKDAVEEIVRNLQRALIEADVNIALVKEISESLRKAAFDERIEGLEKKEHVLKVLHEKLESLLGKEKKLLIKEGQNKIMLLGLYGSGKTTTIAKLGNYFAKRGNRVAIVGLDVHRPAAKEQLLQLGEKNKLKVFVDLEETDAKKTWKKFEKELEKYNIVLIDTAGRHTLDEDLVEELSGLKKIIKPTESILVLPADIGQSAKKLSKEFKDILEITGVIITRMDSTAKGGGALSACAETNAGIYFITTGEKINDLEEFDPKKFLARLLGMGDLETLLEKIKSVTEEKDQKKIEEKIKEGNITLDDVVNQVKSMNELGGFEKITSLIPGFGGAKIDKDILEKEQKKVARWEHMLKSMTKSERENPKLLLDETNRISRVAKGSGTTTTEVRALLKQYEMLKSMLKGGISSDGENFSEKDIKKMMKKMAKLKKFRR